MNHAHTEVVVNNGGIASKEYMVPRQIPQQVNNNSNESSNESNDSNISRHGKSSKSLREQQIEHSQIPEEDQQADEVVVRQVGLGKNAEGFQRTVMKSPTKHNSSEEIVSEDDESSSSSLSSVSMMSGEMQNKNIVAVKRPLMQQANGQQLGPAEEQKQDQTTADARTQIMAAAPQIDNRYENNEMNVMQRQHPSFFENIAAQQHLPNDIQSHQLMRERERMRQNSLSKHFSQSQILLKTNSSGAFMNDLSLSHENNNGFIPNVNNENSLLMNAPPQTSSQHWGMMHNSSFGSNEDQYHFQSRVSLSNNPSLFQNNSLQSLQNQQQTSKNFHNVITPNYNNIGGQTTNMQSSFELGNNYGMKSQYEQIHGQVPTGGAASSFPLGSLVSPRPQNIMNEGGGPSNMGTGGGGFITNNNYNSYQNHQQSNNFMLFNHNNNT